MFPTVSSSLLSIVSITLFTMESITTVSIAMFKLNSTKTNSTVGSLSLRLFQVIILFLIKWHEIALCIKYP